MMTNKGFTLIELIIVITILGILSAVAVPKYVALKSEAKISMMESAQAAMVSSANFVYAKALLAEIEYEESSSVNIDGQVVSTRYGFPAEDEILSLMDLTDDNFVLTVSDGTITHSGVATPADCQVDYTPPDNPGDPPQITLSTNLTCR